MERTHVKQMRERVGRCNNIIIVYKSENECECVWKYITEFSVSFKHYYHQHNNKHHMNTAVLADLTEPWKNFDVLLWLDSPSFP